jgi:bifunctional lysine-specific demethylase and histidyl-hydroxylase NO66
LPVGIDPADEETLAGEVRSIVDLLLSAVAELPERAVARRLVDRLLDAGRPAPLGPLAQASALRSLRPDSRVAWRGELPLVVRDRADGLAVALPGREVAVPGTAGPALTALAAGSRSRVDELPGLDPTEQVDLVRRLLRAGVVVPVGSSECVPPPP